MYCDYVIYCDTCDKLILKTTNQIWAEKSREDHMNKNTGHKTRLYYKEYDEIEMRTEKATIVDLFKSYPKDS